MFQNVQQRYCRHSVQEPSIVGEMCSGETCWLLHVQYHPNLGKCQSLCDKGAIMVI